MARVVAGAVVGSVLALPATAGAIELPGVPPGTLPPEVESAVDSALAALPPEVSGAVDTALADAIGQVTTLDIPGVAQNSATPGHASAAAVNYPGLVTVGKAETTKHSSSVNVLSVGGQDLLTRSGDAQGGTWSGQLAAAGTVLDAINAALCPAGPDAPGSCISLLHARATDASAKSHSAKFHAAKLRLTDSPESLTVLPTSASTTWFTVLGRDRCIDTATAFIATGTGSLAAVALAGVANAISLSVLQPCPEPAAP